MQMLWMQLPLEELYQVKAIIDSMIYEKEKECNKD